MAKRRSARITLDAFLEAVLDAAGFEDDVLLALEVKARELHAWLEAHPHVKPLALEALEEREVDTSGYRLGWLRESQKSAPPDTDANWALYRQLVEEEVVVEAQEALEGAKARTGDLIAKLQAEKRAKLEAKRERSWSAVEPDEP
ncbi:MAG: hypothetical protein HC933_21600 [Pleurocapsa sp. SU_196_0]|nr:hypothetical protein [Pleurocapsa sp. SU_196_0]